MSENKGWVDDNEIKDTDVTKELIDKIATKKHRQELKIQCLSIAHQPDKTPEQVVERAKAYYNFVRT